MDYIDTNTIIPDNYEDMNSYQIIFCPYCGFMNHINIDLCGSIKGLIFCDKCGGEIG